MTFEPHSGEEELQKASAKESALHGENRFEFEPPVDETDLGGGISMGEAAREKIRRDIAERDARRKAEQENSPTAQAARLRAEMARKLGEQ